MVHCCMLHGGAKDVLKQLLCVCGCSGPKGLVCYYYGPKSTVYEELGHAEVVQVQLDPDQAQKEMEKFADVCATSP